MGNFRRDGGGESRSFGGNRGGFGGGRDRGGFGRNRGGFGGRDSGRREMFSAVCSECSKECQIPFKPTSGKPVYCSECFEKMGGERDSRRPGRSNFRPQGENHDQSKIQLDAINVKLDKILAMLQPKADETIKPETTPEIKEIKVEKPQKEKVKKIASKKKK